MISFVKLEKLPRRQRLEKALKIVSAAENRLLLEDHGPENQARFPGADLYGVVEILARDEDFSSAGREALKEAMDLMKYSMTHGVSGDRNLLLRRVNTVKHILLAAAGKPTADWDLLDRTGNLDPSKRRVFSGMRLYLEDLRSPFNVGSIFRSAESFGVEKIFLSPLSADPHHARAKRSAMGCIDLVSWERRGNTSLEELADGLPVFALETGGKALGEFIFPRRGVMLIGSEELGLSPAALSLAGESRLSIPAYGAKGSLNVSVAAGIALQSWSAALLGAASQPVSAFH